MPIPGRHRAALIVAAGAAVMAVAVGIRATLGVFLVPLSRLHGWPLAAFSLDLALQNLFWGLIQPLVGLAADIFGAGRVIAVGALCFACGLWLMATSGNHLLISLGSGLVLGLGLAAVSFPVVLAVVGRAVPVQNRSMAMGLAIAGGSLGQVVLPPLAGHLVSSSGVLSGIAAMAWIALLMLPLAWPLRERMTITHKAAEAVARAQPLTALRLAWRRPGYRLVVFGFFACGFQLAFISIHLPGHLAICGLSPQAGATALGVMGLFNILGCWAAGVLGNRCSLPSLLAALYLVRAVAVAAFLAWPPSDTGVLLFSAVMGVTWLATVPLTSGVIARMFGVRYLGTLFGVAFLSHQIGSFFGAWLGGLVFDMAGTYTAVWLIAGGLGVVAALMHLPIDDSPETRTQPI
jgi:predicted MFS family arabinose efflux permease